MEKTTDDPIKALCILEDGPGTTAILDYLECRQIQCAHAPTMPDIGGSLCEREWDLILLDADMEGADVLSFFQHCRQAHHTVPLIALHNGARGSRDAALIRMGAYDAFPKDIDRWNAEVFLDRAITQALLARKLLSLSRTDHLTGLFNQRYLYECLEREIRRSRRSGRDLTVALLDLDNFKAYNDTHGHLQGDEALAGVARVIRSSIRQGIDSGCRYGGDEFMIILPETSLSSAQRTITRILDNVGTAGPGSMTFSIGLALLGECRNVRDFIRAADEAMYRAKSAGGNGLVQVVCGQGAQLRMEAPG